MNKPADKTDLPQRKRPASGVHISRDLPTIVFVTVCTHNRVPWLAQPDAHTALLAAWTEADAWSIGFYMIMPDHIHFFCAPHDLEMPFGNWMRFWKSRFHKLVDDSDKWPFQGEMNVLMW